MLFASVHRCICVGLRGGWLSTSVGKTSVAILEDIYGFLFIGWNQNSRSSSSPRASIASLGCLICYLILVVTVSELDIISVPFNRRS